MNSSNKSSYMFKIAVKDAAGGVCMAGDMNMEYIRLLVEELLSREGYKHSLSREEMYKLIGEGMAEAMKN